MYIPKGKTKKEAEAMKERISKRDYEELLEIAKEAMYAIEKRGDLETRDNDEEDFLEVSAWGIREALIQAFEYGKKNA